MTPDNAAVHSSSLAAIRDKLSSVRTVVRALFVVDGAMRFALVILGIAVTSFLLDRFLEFPRAMRAILLAAELGLAVAACWRWVVYPIRFPIEIEDVASQVERSNPFLKDRLISALQLERLVGQPDYADSVALSNAVIREAEELAGGIQFMRIVRPRPVILIVLAAVAAAGVLTAAAAIHPRPAKYWAMRNLALADLDWPTDTQLHLVRKRFKVSAEQPTTLRFLLDEPLLPGAELRLLEREPMVDGSAPTRAVRIEEGTAVLAGELAFRETSVPLRLEQTPHGAIALAEIPPARSARPRYAMLRATVEHRVAMLSLEEERVLSPLYEIESVVGRVEQPGGAIEIPVPDRLIYVPRGHNLKIEAVAFGRLAEGRVHYRFASDAAERSDDLASIDRDNRYVFEDFNEIREPIEFRLAGGGHAPTGAPYRVQVRMPPVLESHHIDLVYPSYLGMVADPLLATGQDFLTTPLGTRLRMRIVGEFTAPRSERDEPVVAEPYAAWLRFDNEALGEIPLVQDGPPLPKEGAAGQVRVAFTGELVATRDSSFYFALRGPNRLVNENPSYFQLTVADDRPPDIDLERPSVSQYRASRNATIRMVVKAADDHGLGRVALRYKIDGETKYRELELKAAAAAYKRAYGPGEAPNHEPREARYEFSWDLEAIPDLAEDRKVLFHLTAEDYAQFSRDTEGRVVDRDRGQVTYRYGMGFAEHTETPDRADLVIEIVSKLKIESEISDRLQAIRDAAKKLQKAQVDTAAMTSSYAANERFSPEDLDVVFKLEFQENDLVRGVDDYLRGPLIEIQEKYRENRMTPSSNVGEMIRLASLVHLDLGPQAAKLLKETQSLTDAPAQRALMVKAIEVQGQISAALDTILVELDKWVDLAEVVSEAKDLLDDQKKLNDETKALRDRRR